MGRTLPSITMEFMQEQEAFSRFRRALRRSDQLALDDLFAAARNHLAAAAYAANALPMETFLLAMLLEEHKEVIRLRTLVEGVLGQTAGLPDSAAPVEPIEFNPAKSGTDWVNPDGVGASPQP
jgi:hypothetical protein